ncbi:MAG: CDP-alcohol phosphatidyltransferase family protein [Christensenellales bacterium]|jgi:CDP-diacylglycerol--serine O-phosphatidyltransferase
MPGKKMRILAGYLVKNIPNALTVLNMTVGIIVLFLIVSRIHPNYRVISWWLIVVGVILDALDGWTARRLAAESELGKQLDSFADFLTFGIAPAAVFFTIESMRSPLVLLVLILYPLSGAFRLSRYNVQDRKGYFTGLPITVAGLIQAVGGLLLNGEELWHTVAVVVMTLLLCALMVSTFQLKRPFSNPEKNNRKKAA